MAVVYESDTRFTAIGLSGSGKTCYVMGMYDQMSIGINGFNLVTTNNRAKQLGDMLVKLDENNGMARFPNGTSLNEINDYQFTLTYQGKKIMTFDWMDYGGAILRDMGESAEKYSSLESSIEQSSVVYIFIDGDLLCKEGLDAKIRQVGRRCARYINPFIQKFSAAHEELLPPVVFVITKSDLCAKYLKEGELEKIIEKCFSGVFLNKNSVVYITSVTLGNNISDDNYSGYADPDMYIPFFLGLYYEYLNNCKYIKYLIDQKQDEHRKNIESSNKTIKSEKDHFFYTRKRQERVAKLNESISDANKEIQRLDNILKEYRDLLKAVADQMLRESKNFITIQKGREVLFETESI